MEEYKCLEPNCSRVFKTQRALTHHTTVAHKKVLGTPKKRGPKGANHVEASDQSFERALAYAFGRTQQWLEIYAASLNVPAAAVTRGVADLLHREARGKVLGAHHKVSG